MVTVENDKWGQERRPARVDCEAHNVRTGGKNHARSIGATIYLQQFAKRCFMLTMILRYRVRYYWRKVCNAFGFCPCGNRVNWTSTGRPICPECGR